MENWKNSFKEGLALGLAGNPLPFAQKETRNEKDLEAWLYKELWLPKMPERNKAEHPFATIHRNLMYDYAEKKHVFNVTLWYHHKKVTHYANYKVQSPTEYLLWTVGDVSYSVKIGYPLDYSAKYTSWTSSSVVEEEPTYSEIGPIGIPIENIYWSDFDLYYETDAYGKKGQLCLAAPDPVYGWKTLWEGEKQNDISGDFGKLLWLWDNQSTTGVNILSAGDVVRVTVDGTVYVYTVQATQYDSAVEAGNKWLGLVSGGSTITDDGTDFYFFEMYGGLRAYTRTFGTHSVKFERAITDIPVSSIHTARVQGWLIGRRLAAMRRKKEPVAYLYNEVRLPKLPEWVANYKNALIANTWRRYIVHGFNDYAPDQNLMADGEYSATVELGEHSYSWYEVANGKWEDEIRHSTSGGPYQNEIVWASTDICTISGDLTLSASEPVPVYE